MKKNQELRVLTVGAAGPVASLIVPELLKRSVSIRGFVHKAEEREKVRAAGVAEVFVGELSDAGAVRNSLNGMDAVFYIAPAALENEAEVGKQFVTLALEAGVRRVVFSSVIHPVISTLENHAAKAPVEEALISSGLEYVLLHPGMFFQNLLPAFKKAAKNSILSEPYSTESRFTRVDYRDVAEVASMALTEDKLLYGTFELCTEGNLNRHDVAALMSDVLGQAIAAVREEIPAQAALPPKLTRMFEWYDNHSLLGNSITLRAILDREPRSLRTYFQELKAQS